MLKAVVFDMDETLLQINLSAFIARLARDEAGLLAQIGRRRLLPVFAAYGTAMLELNQAGRDGSRTNRQLFDEHIERRCGIPLADPVIAEAIGYYERAVLPHRNDRVIGARQMPGAEAAVDAVVDAGLRLALFTNPSFSRACIGCRMGWGGLDGMPFELVTTMENSSHCKPDAAYYLEALGKMGLTPEEVLMVGNDPKRDFPAPQIGMPTAYVGGGEPAGALWCGRMADFARDFELIRERFETR